MKELTVQCTTASSVNTEVQRALLTLQDLKCRAFQCRLIPTVNPDTVLGVRVPLLRKFAKEFEKTYAAKEFMNTLPHKYHEEYNLHALLINLLKDYSECVESLDAFLPYVYSWDTCDMIRPKAFKRHPVELPEKIKQWLAVDDTYTVRFAIEMLMSFYLDEQFMPEYLELVASVRSREYYVNMMIAWYFATALAKRYDLTVSYIEQYRLDKWTHNKTIQKAVESFRITDEKKAYLKLFRQ